MAVLTGAKHFTANKIIFILSGSVVPTTETQLSTGENIPNGSIYNTPTAQYQLIGGTWIKNLNSTDGLTLNPTILKSPNLALDIITGNNDGTATLSQFSNTISSKVLFVDTNNKIVNSGLTLAGNNTGNETAASIGVIVNGATNYVTPLDADKIGVWDFANGLFKALTWTNVKATLFTYFKAQATEASFTSINAAFTTVGRNKYIVNSVTKTTTLTFAAIVTGTITSSAVLFTMPEAVDTAGIQYFVGYNGSTQKTINMNFIGGGSPTEFSCTSNITTGLFTFTVTYANGL